jgi:hypothetical protein
MVVVKISRLAAAVAAGCEAHAGKRQCTETIGASSMNSNFKFDSSSIWRLASGRCCCCCCWSRRETRQCNFVIQERGASVSMSRGCYKESLQGTANCRDCGKGDANSSTVLLCCATHCLPPDATSYIFELDGLRLRGFKMSYTHA